jgi:TonB family protein
MNSILRITHPALLAILLTSTALAAQFTISTSKIRRQLPPGQITAGSDPREVLTKAWAAMDTVKSFRFRMECLPNLPDRTAVTEYVSPDRYHTTQKNQETIVIGNDLYEKTGDKPWRKIGDRIDNGDGTASVVIKEPKQKQDDSMKTARDIKLIRAEKIDGVESLLYEYDVYDSSGNLMFMKMKVWVGVTDGLLRRAEGQVQVEPNKVTMVFTYYDYNADIKIEPPELLAELPGPEPVQVAPRLRPNRDATLRPGSPVAIPGLPSPGIGSGSGMGSGNGTGVGPGRGNPNPDGSAKTVDSKPVLLNRPMPAYTDEARDNEVQGVVRLRVLVGEDGSVKRVAVITGLPDGLNEAAVQTAQKMKFRPAMKDGKPVAYWFNNISIEFNLKR